MQIIILIALALTLLQCVSLLLDGVKLVQGFFLSTVALLTIPALVLQGMKLIQ